MDENITWVWHIKAHKDRHKTAVNCYKANVNPVKLLKNRI